MTKLTIVTIAALLLAGCVASTPPAVELGEGGCLRLLSAYYMPDPKPPANSHAVEGAAKPPQFGVIFKPMQELYKRHADFGGARVVVRNDSGSEVRIEHVSVNGKPIQEHYVDFLDGQWDDRGVVWYRVRPKVLAPGECSEIYIRFRRHPAGSKVSVSVKPQEGKALKAVFGYDDPGLLIDYVTTDASQRRLYLYARGSKGSSGRLKTVALDGQRLQRTRVYGPDFPGNVCLVVAELAGPLKMGDYHIVQATTNRGRSVAAQFRVLPFWFMRTGWRWGPASVEEVREVSMNYVESALSVARAEELGVYTGAGGHERQRLQYLHDEPDAGDIHPDFRSKHDSSVAEQGPLYTGTGWAVGLGRLARGMVDSGNIEEIERERPHVATYLITNGTTRPLHWFVYGQLADIASTDPYPANYYGADWATVREHYMLMREAAAPRPAYACLEAYTGDSPDPKKMHRGPSGPEFRQMAVQALGCGVKGINSWFWSRGSGMLGANYLPDVRAAYIRINKLTEHIEDELVLGTPINIVTNDSGLTITGSWFFFEDGPYKLEKPWMKERVWTGALLCGPDAIVIAAANHIAASRTKPEHIEPARNVNITVQLPDFLRKVECFEVDADGLTPYACRVERGKAVFTLAAIESGRIFLLRRR